MWVLFGCFSLIQYKSTYMSALNMKPLNCYEQVLKTLDSSAVLFSVS